MTEALTRVSSDATGRAARPARVLLALVVVVLSYGLLQTMLVPTIGALQRELHTTATAASWAVLSSTLLASVVLTPVVGRLGDRFGKRRVLLGCLGVFLVGTVGAAAAPGVGVLIGFRAVQGISLALLPLSFALVRELLPPARVPFGLALTAGLVGGAAGAGLLLGGVLVDYASWRWIFVLGSLLVVAAGVLTWAFVPPDRPGAPGRSDLAGALVLTVGLVALLLGITEGPARGWSSAGVLGLFGLAVAALLGFVAVERRAADPLIDLALLARRPLLVAHLGSLALGASQFICYVLVPRLAELPRTTDSGFAPGPAGFGLSVTGAALVLLPGTLLTLPASWLAAPLERRLGTRTPLVAGLGLAAGGGALLAVWHGEIAQVVLCYLVCSVGYGFAMAALPRLVNQASPVEHSGSANGVNTVARVLGGALGSQLGAAVVAGGGGFGAAFWLAAVVAAVGGGLALFVGPAR
ncbi:MAG TPA: MFS transporter [Pseudonocardia sp.]|jgi:MFS family permease|nr:MFS transporter [Pseudonocardia sp.]